MKPPPGSLSTLALLAGGAAAALAIGFWEGHPFLLLGLYGVGVAAWLLWQQARFAHWLKRGGQSPAGNRWADMAAVIQRRSTRERHRTRRLARWVRRHRDASALFPDGVVLLDSAGRIEWLNARAARLLDLDRRRDAGERLTNLVRHPEMNDYLEDADPDEQLVIESPVDSAVLLGLQVVDLGQGQRMIVVKDVTAFETSESARRDFVANASHELRSPLTVIRGYLDAMTDDDAIDPSWREPIAEMARQSRRMSDLLRDLMDLSRLDRMYRPAELNRIAMSELLHRVCADALSSARAERIVSIDADEALDLLGDQPEIALLVTNLVSNALHYTGDNGRIGVRWNASDTGAVLVVEDNGIGIPAEDIPRLTERFYRVDKGRSRERGGTGLGLAIVHNALERHGASLEIHSELGRGSVFSCHFPEQRIVYSPLPGRIDGLAANQG